ncbi:MAG TPA: EAL domain-containing protein [Solirubrobacterales bacterium]|nr:EAL domain-containing protein [Solirubrobacterales bacterium]
MSIERDDPIQRARQTAAVCRVVLGLFGIILILARPDLLPITAAGIAGFAVIVLTALLQLADLKFTWVQVEESVASSAAILIIGLGNQNVTVISLLWLIALAAGVMARGGRVHWIGRTLVVAALALPIARAGSLSLEYGAFCVALLGLQLTAGQLTIELNRLLGQARHDAENAETLLLAGEIASRVAHHDEAPAPPVRPSSPGPATPPSAAEVARTRAALGRLIAGEGLGMVVQPIVDLRSRRVHAYEALARFGRRATDHSPLHWFAIAEELDERPALERACMRAALELFEKRPDGTRLAVNLSIPALLDPATHELLADFAGERRDGLEGLIVEITEETLVGNTREVLRTGDALRELGARLAVDDVGAGYSGLRQIIEVLPDYLKLDRALVAGIDTDPDRAALVSAIAGYSRHVRSLLVAEGIERPAELRRLESLDVPLAQGFHLALPAEPWPAVDLAVPARSEPALELPGSSSTGTSPAGTVTTGTTATDR